MRIVIAPNAFKNSLNATDVAVAIEQGLKESSLACETHLFPVGDGGDGTGLLITSHRNGRIIRETTVDPFGRDIVAEFGLIDGGKTAVIEMAAASGLHLLKKDELDPLRASSFGTGIQVKQALDHRSEKILLCVGGSATVDGGCGLLRALGFRLMDADGKILERLPSDLRELAYIDDTSIDQRLQHITIDVLCDVKNPLVGDEGAAAVFGPQKGATAQQVMQLEAGLKQLAAVIHQQKRISVTSVQHGGAAGGIAATLFGLLDAKLVSGSDYFLQVTGFEQTLQNADLVITGEGSLDRQTLAGKAPYAIAGYCKQRSTPVIALTGKIEEDDRALLEQYFAGLLNINRNFIDLETAIAATRDNLVQTAKELGDTLAQKSRLQL